MAQTCALPRIVAAAVGPAGHGVPGGVEVVGPERFKIRKDHLRARPVPDPDRLDRECSPEDQAAVREGIGAYLPEANGPIRRMVACMFTTSPDEHFILDRHPAMDDAFIAAGFSGHGYKSCSVIGRIMADFCLGEEGTWGVEGVSSERCRESCDACAALNATVDNPSKTLVRDTCGPVARGTPLPFPRSNAVFSGSVIQGGICFVG
ncbi:MAG: FAD-dependent oxidoreductase [Gammaproteobacteria bacterium]|nr:FAD-dependent oxidoreductase [Gammaproteobacteria bacterium]